MEYSKSTLADVPKIVETIQALRSVSKNSKVQTTKTQSEILRQLPPGALTEVALQLEVRGSEVSRG